MLRQGLPYPQVAEQPPKANVSNGDQQDNVEGCEKSESEAVTMQRKALIIKKKYRDMVHDGKATKKSLSHLFLKFSGN